MVVKRNVIHDVLALVSVHRIVVFRIFRQVLGRVLAILLINQRPADV